MLVLQIDGGFGLAQRRYDGDARMASHHGDVHFRRVNAVYFTNECTSAYDVQSGHAKNSIWIKFSSLEIGNKTVNWKHDSSVSLSHSQFLPGSILSLLLLVYQELADY